MRTFSWEKKEPFLTEPKSNFRKNQKKATARTRKGSFPSFYFHPYKPKTKAKKILFLLYSSFKHSIEANKIQGSQFSSQQQIKTVNTLWREINTASTSFSTPFFIIFFVLFNFLFDSIYFYFCVDYLLIIFLLFLIFWWV